MSVHNLGKSKQRCGSWALGEVCARLSAILVCLFLGGVKLKGQILTFGFTLFSFSLLHFGFFTS